MIYLSDIRTAHIGKRIAEEEIRQVVQGAAYVSNIKELDIP